MIAPLSQDQKDLILYCLEQQYYEFDKAEQRDYEFIITKLGLKTEAPTRSIYETHSRARR